MSGAFCVQSWHRRVGGAFPSSLVEEVTRSTKLLSADEDLLDSVSLSSPDELSELGACFTALRPQRLARKVPPAGMTVSARRNAGVVAVRRSSLIS